MSKTPVQLSPTTVASTFVIYAAATAGSMAGMVAFGYVYDKLDRRNFYKKEAKKNK
jgi:hypothetical protein